MTAIVDVLAAGGVVSGPLVLVCFALWLVAMLRWMQLRRGFRGGIGQYIEQSLKRVGDDRGLGCVGRYLEHARIPTTHSRAWQHRLEGAFHRERERLQSYALVLTALVTVAPLLGLLGTVNGMVETFASLQGLGASHATEQTVAGGISAALISTQLGLVIGVPGLALLHLLKQREAARVSELEQVHSIMMARGVGVP